MQKLQSKIKKLRAELQELRFEMKDIPKEEKEIFYNSLKLLSEFEDILIIKYINKT